MSETKSEIDVQTIKAIEDIVKRGNDAEIRRKGNGYIVLEVKKTIKYSTQRIGAVESHRG